MRPSKHHSVRSTDDALRACVEPMDARAKAEIRSRVMAAAKTSAPSRSLWRLPQRIAAGVAVATALSGGIAYAASDALPGDFLYPVKRAIENAALAALPEGELERKVLVDIAAERAEEAARLHQEGPVELSAEALRELRDALERVSGPGSSLTEAEQAQIREGSGQHGDTVHDAVDDVIGTESGEAGTSAPSESGTGSGTGSGSGSGGGPDNGPDAGPDSSGDGSQSGSGGPPDTGGSGAGSEPVPGPGRN